MNATESAGVAVPGEDAATPATTEPVRPELDTPVPAVLAAALVAAWAELSNIAKTKTADAGSYKYQYAGLDDLLDVARPVLARHGLAVLQPVERHGTGQITVETWLLHCSGNLVRWRFDAAAGNTAQSAGSAISYSRRYCLLAALGMASEGEDDDGHAATTAATVTPPRQTRPRAADDDRTRQRKNAMALFGKLGLSDRDVRLNVTSAILGREVPSWNDVSPMEANRVISELTVRLEEQDEVDGLADAWDAEASDAEG